MISTEMKTSWTFIPFTLKFGRTYSIQKVKLDLVANSSNDAIGLIGQGFIDGYLNGVGHTESGGGSRSEQKKGADGLHFAGVDVWVGGSREDSCGYKMQKESKRKFEIRQEKRSANYSKLSKRE